MRAQKLARKPRKDSTSLSCDGICEEQFKIDVNATYTSRMELTLLWVAEIFSATQKFTASFKDLSVYHHVHERLNSIWVENNPVFTIIPYT
jgi:hypothetical protein